MGRTTINGRIRKRSLVTCRDVGSREIIGGGGGNHTRDPIYNLLIFIDKYLANTLWIVFARGTLKFGIRVSACC